MKIHRKDKTVNNLHTKGGEYQVFNVDDKTQAPNYYIGPYHLKGKMAYIGSEPRTGARKLRKVVKDRNVFTYNKLNTTYAKKFGGVINSPPTILQQDEDKGFFSRYFAKKLNTGEIIEINKVTYKDVSKDKSPHHKLYSTVEVEWKISGPIFNILYKQQIIEHGIVDTNMKTISLLNQTMPGITEYLSDALEYANPREQDNLYSPGDQLMTVNRDEYVGYYHIHGNRPMEGRYHTPTGHNYLEPMSQTVFDEEELTEEEKILQTPKIAYNLLV